MNDLKHYSNKTTNDSTSLNISNHKQNKQDTETKLSPTDLDYDKSIGDWIIDTDPGIDDAFALTLAINLLKDNLKLISIQSGNVGLNQCVINAKKLCVINDRKYNICKGQEFTISTLNLRTFSSIHGVDGFFDIEDYQKYEEKYDQENVFTNKDQEKSFSMLKRHSAVEIIELSKKYSNVKIKSDKKLNILTIGPLTNLSLAYMLDPSIVNRINRLVIMGGAYTSFGNIMSTGEFNFACDNIAAKIVLNKFNNVEVYCWEPSLNHLVMPENILFNKEIQHLEKAKFIKHCVNKKMSGLQGGVYADYGAAVAAFSPNSVKHYINAYCDIVIDSEKNKESRFIISKENIFTNKKKQRCKVIEYLNLSYFHGLFNKMINDH